MAKILIVPMTPKFASHVVMALRAAATLADQTRQAPEVMVRFNELAQLITEIPCVEAEVNR